MQIYIAEWPNSQFGKISWRSLTWMEVRKFDADLLYLPDQIVSNEIYNLVKINGPDLEVVTAGIVQYIIDIVFTVSSFRNIESAKFKLIKKRAEISSDYFKHISALLASKFNYKFEEIDKWDENTFFERIAQLELIENRTFDITTSKEVEDLKNKSRKQKPSKSPKQEGSFGENF